MKHNLDLTNIIALEALDEQLDRYAASVPLGSRKEGGEETGESHDPAE